jgi:L-threonylcarbamoyladenylate synthase
VNCPRLAIAQAADALLAGGIIAYPTEGVFGLGCLPDDASAVIRILHLKQRTPAKGLILIASRKAQLDEWIEAGGNAIPDSDPSSPTTWVAQPAPGVLPLIRGDNRGIAVRLTTHPTAAAICDAVASPIVSTSANLAGMPPARNRWVLRRQFGRLVDYIVPGDCGPMSGPSEIRELQTGKVLRPRTT